MTEPADQQETTTVETTGAAQVEVDRQKLPPQPDLVRVTVHPDEDTTDTPEQSPSATE